MGHLSPGSMSKTQLLYTRLWEQGRRRSRKIVRARTPGQNIYSGDGDFYIQQEVCTNGISVTWQQNTIFTILLVDIKVLMREMP